MIFIESNLEKQVQVNDKTRLDFVKTYMAEDENSAVVIDKFEIDPDNQGVFYDVTSKKYLDFSYALEGVKTVVAKVTLSDLSVVTKNFTLTVLTEAEDNLFSVDADIVPYEPDIMQWVQEGRTSFLDKHRTAQVEILNELDASGIWKDDSTRYVASDIVDTAEFKELSKYTALRIIMQGISNDVGDVWSEKATYYNSMATQARKRAYLRLDKSGDGETQLTNIFTTHIRRA